MVRTFIVGRSPAHGDLHRRERSRGLWPRGLDVGLDDRTEASVDFQPSRCSPPRRWCERAWCVHHPGPFVLTAHELGGSARGSFRPWRAAQRLGPSCRRDSRSMVINRCSVKPNAATEPPTGVDSSDLGGGLLASPIRWPSISCPHPPLASESAVCHRQGPLGRVEVAHVWIVLGPRWRQHRRRPHA